MNFGDLAVDWSVFYSWSSLDLEMVAFIGLDTVRVLE